MWNLFASIDRKKVVRNLADIGMTETTEKQETSFRNLAILIVSKVVDEQHLSHYFCVMRETVKSPALILKFAAFVHVFFQERNFDREPMLQFIRQLLACCSVLIQKYSAEKNQKKNEKTDRKRSLSSCSQKNSQHKQIFLLQQIVQPYLAYLMKAVISRGEDQQGAGELENYDAWKMINLLRMISAVTSNFTMIGRYYMRPYGALVVLLTKILSRDIYFLIESTGKYIKDERNKILCFSEIDFQELSELMEMLEEIAKINDSLYTVYLGKYFFERIKDVSEPPWLNINAKEFDSIFKLYRQAKDSLTRSTEKCGSN